MTLKRYLIADLSIAPEDQQSCDEAYISNPVGSPNEAMEEYRKYCGSFDSTSTGEDRIVFELGRSHMYQRAVLFIPKPPEKT